MGKRAMEDLSLGVERENNKIDLLNACRNFINGYRGEEDFFGDRGGSKVNVLGRRETGVVRDITR